MITLYNICLGLIDDEADGGGDILEQDYDEDLLF